MEVPHCAMVNTILLAINWLIVLQHNHRIIKPFGFSCSQGSRGTGKVHSFGKRDHSIKRNLNIPVVVRGWLYKQVSWSSSAFGEKPHLTGTYEQMFREITNKFLNGEDLLVCFITLKKYLWVLDYYSDKTNHHLGSGRFSDICWLGN